MNGSHDLLQEKLSSCCDHFPDADVAAANDDDYDDFFFLAKMLVFCSKIYSRFIECSIMAIFSGASCVSLCQSERFP
jgi:hypothetical protein